MYVDIRCSNRHDKRYLAIFYDDNKKKIKSVLFDVSDNNNLAHDNFEQVRADYINAHFKDHHRDWEDPMMPSSLSRYVLYEYKHIHRAIHHYMKRFGLKQY